MKFIVVLQPKGWIATIRYIDKKVIDNY